MSVYLCLVILFFSYLCHSETSVSDRERLEKLEKIVANVLEKFNEKETRISQLEGILLRQSERITSLEETVRDQEVIIQTFHEYVKKADVESQPMKESDSSREWKKDDEPKLYSSSFAFVLQTLINWLPLLYMYIIQIQCTSTPFIWYLNRCMYMHNNMASSLLSISYSSKPYIS